MCEKVAVVLSGGGAKGAYEAGALTEIVKRTRWTHIVTGGSIGAIMRCLRARMKKREI